MKLNYDVWSREFYTNWEMLQFDESPKETVAVPLLDSHSWANLSTVFIESSTRQEQTTTT